MKWSQMLLIAVVLGGVAAAIRLMYYLETPRVYVAPTEVFVATILIVLCGLWYATSAPERAKRRAAFTMIAAAVGILTKAGLSGGLKLIAAGESAAAASNGEFSARGILELLLESDWRVDCCLTLAAFGSFYLSYRLLTTVESTTPDIAKDAWSRLQSSRGCKQYLIEQVAGETPHESKLLQELLNDVLVNHTDEWRQVLEDHKLGKRKAQQLLFKALGRFRAELDQLYDLHGNILPHLKRIRDELDFLQK